MLSPCTSKLTASAFSSSDGVRGVGAGGGGGGASPLSSPLKNNIHSLLIFETNDILLPNIMGAARKGGLSDDI